ncbi:MAG TPA: UPF0182 family protein [Leptolyngbyaceae cyanobacterium]
MFYQPIVKLIILLIGLWLGFDLVSNFVAELLWFQEVGYSEEFLLRLQTQAALWTIALASAAFLFFNLTLAQKQENKSGENNADKVAPLTLSWLLPLVLVLVLIIIFIFLYYGLVALSYWHPDYALANVLPPLPLRFGLISIWQTVLQLWRQLLLVAIVPVLAIAIIWHPHFFLKAIGLLISLSFGLVLSGHWSTFLQYLNSTLFNSTEPLFGLDITFYIFTLPFWELLEFWLLGIFLYAWIAVALIYLLSGKSLSNGLFLGFTQQQQRHLYALGSAVSLCLSFSFWLRRYELVYSTRGVMYGANYTDVKVQLPLYLSIVFIYFLLAIIGLFKTVFWDLTISKKTRKIEKFLLLCLLVFSVNSLGVPELVQYLIVQPNELARERPYIQRSITLTRQAFNLEKIKTETFNPTGKLSYADIKQNDLTIRNIRLWDNRPLLQTNRQLQQIRPYYKFPSADIDRYTLKEDNLTTKRQVIVAARELDYSNVPQQAQTWINKHLIYTHGYGFTISPVNIAGEGGLPYYFVRDIGDGLSNNSSNGGLRTSSPEIRHSIPIANPRIYYGEISDTYVMTGNNVQELDYPSGDENVYNTYDGEGGISIASWWRRLLFAKYLKDWQMLLTNNFTSQTKLLFRRNINLRVRNIAPFLRYDSQPYLVAADTSYQNGKKKKLQSSVPSYLYWIIDAYTISDRYPYSEPNEEKFNYIRNSVKVVIDAYHGDVKFYVADPSDPIIKTWSTIFPKMFKSLDAMPNTLRSHIRYPVDLFKIQSNRLLTYHMIDPQVFYNREDLWQLPTEIYASKPQIVEPYYLIMRLPTERQEEFILLLPFTPVQRNNLIAWLAARSDREEYGKLLLYQFPKQKLVYGQEQIEALINQDPAISQQISLWNRQGSRVIQGNLLVIPIEESLLYVEPLYLEAEQNSLPTLVRVIVVYENRIVMAESLEQAFQAIFQTEELTPAIIRPV